MVNKIVWKLCALMILFVFLSGCVQTSSEDKIKEKINKNLIGTKIKYNNLAGKESFFVVDALSIKNVEKVSLDNKTVWKARIGESVAWDIYFDESGSRIIKQEQLFKT